MLDLQNDVLEVLEIDVLVRGREVAGWNDERPRGAGYGLAKKRCVELRAELVHASLNHGDGGRLDVPVDELLRIAATHHGAAFNPKFDLSLTITLKIPD